MCSNFAKHLFYWRSINSPQNTYKWEKSVLLAKFYLFYLLTYNVYENKSCVFRSVTPLILFGETGIHSGFNDNGNRSCKIYVDGFWSRINLFLSKADGHFLVSRIIKIHLFDPANGSCFCAACQLHKIA